ncbi:MAG: LPS assembly protein LptD [Phycisphaerales bacterium]
MNLRKQRASAADATAPQARARVQRRNRLYLRAAWSVTIALGVVSFIAEPRVHAAEGDAPAKTVDPLADPIVHSDAVFFARKVTAWESDGASWLLLEGDAGFSTGVYGFRADAAAVRIDTEKRPGKTIRHLSIYLDNAKHLRGAGPVSAEAPRLLVTVSTTGDVQVHNDLFERSNQPPANPLIGDAQARMQRHREAMARVSISPPAGPLFDPSAFESRLAKGYQPGPATRPRVDTQPIEVTPVPDAPTTTTPAVVTGPSTVPPPVPSVEKQPDTKVAVTDQTDTTAAETPAQDDNVLPTRGTVNLLADRVVYDQGDAESTVMLIGNVRLFYEEYEKSRQVSLKAERVVVFLDGSDAGPVAPASVDAGRVRGVYLEDNVIVTDAGFTVRAPRVYYDVRNNRATLLEAVVYSYDATRQLPLYMRAETVRQTSASSFEAEGVQLTTSEFAEPHFAIGAARLTLDQEQVEGGVSNKFTATNTTLRVKDTPFFIWPYMEGRMADIPLKRVKVGYDSDHGAEIETTWDVFALAGREAPDGVDLLGRADYLGDHGPAVGADLEYGLPNMFGEARAYLLAADNGTDEIGGRDIEQDGDPRGFYQWQHRHYLENGSELSLESAYVSDETFLEEFFRDQATEAKSYETSLYWKKQQGDQALTFLTKYDINDFTPQLTTLQSPGYTVDKAPEVGYYRTGTSFADDRLTWFSENRAGFVRARPGEDTPLDRGFGNNASMTLFGIPNTTAFDDALYATGVPDEWVFRADSRQEINAPMDYGDFRVVPYAVGRITAYDEDFSAYAGEDQNFRLWGSLGTRVSTELHRTYDTVSQLLDVNGIRHIIEPSVDVFFSGATIDSEDLPVYDPDVEALHDGAGARFGLTNTFQTQRGGEGRWRTVDWIVLRTDLVLRSDDSDVDTEIARFFEQRPEYSAGGDHIYTELLWMVTDTLGLAGELTHSLEDDRVVQWRVGGTLQHTPRFSTFTRYDEIDLLDSRLLSFGFTYILTLKYEMGFQQRIDFARDESQSTDVWLERRVPKWRIRLTASLDEIDDNQTIGIVLIPEGFGGGPSPLLR